MTELELTYYGFCAGCRQDTCHIDGTCVACGRQITQITLDLGGTPSGDAVSHPAHYTSGDIETIDYIRSALGDAFVDYCIGNVIKYVSRWRLKNGVEDLRKALQYLDWALESQEV